MMVKCIDRFYHTQNGVIKTKQLNKKKQQKYTQVVKQYSLIYGITWYMYNEGYNHGHWCYTLILPDFFFSIQQTTFVYVNFRNIRRNAFQNVLYFIKILEVYHCIKWANNCLLLI